MGKTYKRESSPSAKKSLVRKQNKKNRDTGKDFSCVSYNKAEDTYIEEVGYADEDGFEKFSKPKHGKR